MKDCLSKMQTDKKVIEYAKKLGYDRESMEAVARMLEQVKHHKNGDIYLGRTAVTMVMQYTGSARIGHARCTKGQPPQALIKSALTMANLPSRPNRPIKAILVLFGIHPDADIMKISQVVDAMEEQIDKDALLVFGTQSDVRLSVDCINVTILITME